MTAVASAVVEHVRSAIVPTSAAMAAAAAGAPLARWLAGARHRPRPTIGRPTVVVVAADHGVVDPGPSLGADHPTAIALAAIAGGDAAVTRLAAASGARVVTLDAGVAVPSPSSIPLVPWRATADLVARPAMTPAMAVAALEGGVAAATALCEDGADLLVLGAVGVGGELAAAAVIAALTGTAVGDGDDGPLVAAALARLTSLAPPASTASTASTAPPSSVTALTALTALAELGGGDLGASAGLILTAAALHVPVIVDGVVALAGALLAARLAPAVTGYLLAAHAGGGSAASAARTALGLTPLVAQGLGRGDGAGGALVLPLVTAAAALDEA